MLTSQFPIIDQAQACRQLELLNFKSRQNVYLRFFYPSDDSRKDKDKGRKAERLRWKEIEDYQRQGRGVYFVVNGGGHKDSEVTHSRAIFYEHDNLDKTIQRDLWQHLGLSEPTFQVDTGGKSIHSYWVLDEPISIQQWRELQSDLLEFSDGDRAIKNPSRVMRLAGAWHISFDDQGKPVYRQSQIISDSGETYTYEELRQTIPKAAAEKQTLSSQNYRGFGRFSCSKDLPKHPGAIQIPVAEAVPLETCLAKESRSLLKAGVGEGGRNSGGAKLARDLLGTANYLGAIGQTYHGDPRQLLEKYASRCTPPLPAKEVEAIWKSAQQANPTPSCQNEGVEACIRGWYWREYVQPARSQHSVSSQLQGAAQSNENSFSLLEQIQGILSRYESDSLRTAALIDLAQAAGKSYRDVEQLARIVQQEGEIDEEVVEAIASLQSNLTQFKQRLDVKSHLHPSLANLLLETAEAMPTAIEYLFNTLLSASASRIGTAARIIVNPSGGYKQPCIFWTANVSHSGQAKTPPQQVIIKPLEDLESEANQNYEEYLKEYKGDNSGETSPPSRQRFLLNNVTTQTKIRLHHENPRGLLEYLDELVSDYTRLNQFKSGKGDDLQLELGFFNGSSTNYDRSDARLFLAKTAFSKTGTYQWETLARLMSDETNFTASGYAARFLYCSIPDAPKRHIDLFKKTDAVDKLQAKLRWLYEELSKLPERDYLLDDQAKKLFQSWNGTLVDAEIEEKHFGVSIVYSKIESYTARLALWLHLHNALLAGEIPAPVISGSTMQSAIEIASFYLGQHKLIQAHNSPTRKLEGIYLKIQTQAEKLFSSKGVGVKASFLKTRINALKKWGTEKIRQAWKQLVAAGHGQIVGEGSQAVYIPNAVGAVGEQLVQPPTSESFVQQELQEKVGEVGGLQPLSLFSQSTNFSQLDEQVLNNKTKGSDSAIATENLLDSKENDARLLADSLPHQFTNSKDSNSQQDEDIVVGEPHQLHHQPPTQESEDTSSIQDLQALLLACETLVQLQAFKKEYGQRSKEAYRSLSPQQQQQIDVLAAQAVPHKVYRYIGKPIECDGQKLPTGALVYIEPAIKTPNSVGCIPVWLLRGLKLGWQKAIAVSRDYLELVKEAVEESATFSPDAQLPGFGGG